MAIIVRITQDAYKKELGWDKNRCDIELVPRDEPKEVAKAICGFVASNQSLVNTRYHWVRILDQFADSVEAKLKTLGSFPRAWCLRAAQAEALEKAKLIAWTNPDTRAAQREVCIESRADFDAASQFYKRTVLRVGSFDWPFPTNGVQCFPDQGAPLKYGLRFVDQGAIAYGTGSMFAPGYVITAGHCVEDDYRVRKSRLYFNLRASSVRMKNQQTWDPTKDEATGHVKYDALQCITRVILRSVPPANYSETSVDNVVIHDIGIVEMTKHVTRFFSGKPNPLYTIGHPHGLPLKYAGAAKDLAQGDKAQYLQTQPGIRWAPNYQTQFSSHTSISADIDVFGGNSGGPLLEVETNEVVGIMSSSRTGSPSPPRPSATFQSQIHEYLQDVEEIEGRTLDQFDWGGGPTGGFDQRTLFSHGAIELHPDNRELTLAHVLPWEPDHLAYVKTSVIFNRVDLFAGFCGPLTRFLKKQPRGFRIQMRIEALCDTKDFAFSPTIRTEDGRQHLCRRNLPAKPKETLAPAVQYAALWAEEFYSADELQLAAPGSCPVVDENTSNPIRFFPRELFHYESGMCAWSKLEIQLPASSVKGNITVIYGYDIGKAVKFEIDLHFERVKANNWLAYLGQINEFKEPETTPFTPRGTTWSAPTEANLNVEGATKKARFKATMAKIKERLPPSAQPDETS